MKCSVLLFLALVAFLRTVHGEDTRIARFNVTRAFEEYQLTKDIKSELEARINQSKSDPDRRAQELREYLERQMKEFAAKAKEADPLRHPYGKVFPSDEDTIRALLRLDDARLALTGASVSADPPIAHEETQRKLNGLLEERAKQLAAGGAVRESLTIEIQAAKGQLSMIEARFAMESVERELAMREAVVLKRVQILNDIWAMAAKLRAERGFMLIVPVNGPDEDQFLTIVVSAECEDVTDALVERLNREYAAKKAK